MKPTRNKLPSTLMRVMTAGEYSVRAMELMDEAKWIIDIMQESYKDLLENEDLENIKKMSEQLKSYIHVLNISSNDIFIKLDEEVANASTKVQHQTVEMPKEIVKYENDNKLMVTFPDECKFHGYSTWLSKKFVHETPDAESYQVNYYKDWKFSIYKYEQSDSGRKVPILKQVIAADAFKDDITLALRLYQKKELEYPNMEESHGI